MKSFGFFEFQTLFVGPKSQTGQVQGQVRRAVGTQPASSFAVSVGQMPGFEFPGNNGS